MKKILVLLLTSMVLLCGCGNKSEHIELWGHSDMVFDNTSIDLKKGYFVEDYDIDYDNMTVTLYLYKEDN